MSYLDIVRSAAARMDAVRAAGTAPESSDGRSNPSPAALAAMQHNAAMAREAKRRARLDAERKHLSADAERKHLAALEART